MIKNLQLARHAVGEKVIKFSQMLKNNLIEQSGLHPTSLKPKKGPAWELSVVLRKF